MKPVYQPKYLHRCEADALPSAAGVIVICCEKGDGKELMLCQKVDHIKEYALAYTTLLEKNCKGKLAHYFATQQIEEAWDEAQFLTEDEARKRPWEEEPGSHEM